MTLLNPIILAGCRFLIVFASHEMPWLLVSAGFYCNFQVSPTLLEDPQTGKCRPTFVLGLVVIK